MSKFYLHHFNQIHSSELPRYFCFGTCWVRKQHSRIVRVFKEREILLFQGAARLWQSIICVLWGSGCRSSHQLLHSSHLSETVLFPRMLYRVTISSCCFLSPLIQIWSEICVKQGTVLLLKLATAAAERVIYISEQLYKGSVNNLESM